MTSESEREVEAASGQDVEVSSSRQDIIFIKWNNFENQILVIGYC